MLEMSEVSKYKHRTKLCFKIVKKVLKKCKKIFKILNLILIQHNNNITISNK